MSQRVTIYARQSVEKDEGDKSLSLESQVATLRARCAAEGWHVVGEERESGLRGWMDESERPALARCIERAVNGDYDTLLVWDMSRLARSVRLQEDWIWRLTRVGVDVVSHSEPHAQDEMMRVIVGAFNQRQRKDTATRVRNALTERARRGYHHGRLPFGYRREERAAKLTPDPEQAPIVRELFVRYVAGENLSELTRDLSRRRIPTMHGAAWERTTVQTILTNPVYAGRVRFGGVLTEDAHPALVSPELWEQAQARKANYTYQRYKDISSWVEGRITHACGAKMYLSSCGRKSPQPHFLCGRRCVYLAIDPDGDPVRERCQVHPGRARQSYVEHQAWLLITRMVREVLPEDEIVAFLERRQAERGPQVADERAALETRRERALSRRQRAEELYLSGSRDRAWFDAEDAATSADLALIDRELARLPAVIHRPEISARRASLLALASRIEDVQPAHRHLVLAELGSVVIGPGRNLQPSVHIRPHERLRHLFPERYHR